MGVVSTTRSSTRVAYWFDPFANDAIFAAISARSLVTPIGTAGSIFVCISATIDETPIRQELSTAERAEHTARRKVLYGALHPETALGANNQHTAARRQNGEEQRARFTKATAEATGQSERAVQRDALLPQPIILFLGDKLVVLSVPLVMRASSFEVWTLNLDHENNDDKRYDERTTDAGGKRPELPHASGSCRLAGLDSMQPGFCGHSEDHDREVPNATLVPYIDAPIAVVPEALSGG